LKTKNKKAQTGKPINKDKPIDTYEDLKSSCYCMMYFARGCKNKRYARGLCDKHYHMIRRCVVHGSLKWERIEAQLKALPLQPRENFKQWLEELSV
jgi:hypothetical protein